MSCSGGFFNKFLNVGTLQMTDSSGGAFLTATVGSSGSGLFEIGSTTANFLCNASASKFANLAVTGPFGANDATPVGRYVTSGASGGTLAQTTALANQLYAALVSAGIVS